MPSAHYSKNSHSNPNFLSTPSYKLVFCKLNQRNKAFTLDSPWLGVEIWVYKKSRETEKCVLCPEWR